jgi:hypothetical protein
MTWHLDNKKLVFADGASLAFPEKIAKAVEAAGTIVVRLDTDEPRQVYGIRDKRVVWQAPKLPEGFGVYVDVEVIDRILYVWDFAALRIQLDPSNGQVVDVLFTK